MTKNGFQNEKGEAVYDYLAKNGSEYVATLITKFFNTDQIGELYDELVREDEILEVEYAY